MVNRYQYTEYLKQNNICTVEGDEITTHTKQRKTMLSFTSLLFTHKNISNIRCLFGRKLNKI